jgi:putative hydrolase of the HAD superfamily
VRKDIDGIAFDLDGTLYPNYRFYIRLIPFILKEPRLLWALGKARRILRGDSALKHNQQPRPEAPPRTGERALGLLFSRSGCTQGFNTSDQRSALSALKLARESVRKVLNPFCTNKAQNQPYYTEADKAVTGSFYERQSCLMGKILKRDPGEIQEKTERLIYRGWEPLFKGLRLFPLVKETIQIFRDEGVKTGLLSDFPPEMKLEYLGLSGLWDTVLCSETFGFLKPDPVPFAELAFRMGIKPERLLYVGNNITYDIEGARNAGLQAALICSSRLKKHYRGNAALVFSNYRQLYNYMLG